MRWFLPAVLVAVAAIPAVDARVTSVPPARQPATAVQKVDAAPGLLAPALPPARVVDLGGPAADALSPIGRVLKRDAVAAGRDARGRRNRGGPLQVGIARDVPAPLRVLDGSSLTWHDAGNGGRIARVEIRSARAAGLRVRVEVPAGADDVELRFVGAGSGQAFGPYRVGAIRAEPEFWSPVLEGERATVEIHAASQAHAQALRLAIPQVSHLAAAGNTLRTFRAKREVDIGDSDACEIDIACVANPSQALLDAASAVAKILFTDRGITYLCTGTVLNDTLATFRPYLATAHHCLRTQAEASTVNTYWFFDARTCNSLAVPPYVLLPDGAKLLAGSNDFDWTLVELRRRPPAGVVYSAWRAEPIPIGAIASTVHHPSGDLKKFSQGQVAGYSSQLTFHSDGTSSGGGTFVDVQWAQGSTEVGSSGAGLFTFRPQGGYYELRGTLFAGDASCANPTGLDYFSRLDVALPLLQEYLTPDSGYPPGITPVVEFYHAGLDHYFITADPVEIGLLDQGTQIRGWVRTGFRFLAYTSTVGAPLGISPVCRFYLRPGVGDSHFYSASPTECAEVQQRFGASWIYESPSVFWIQLPNQFTGQCPLGTTPIFRFYDALRLNHRFTAEVSLRDDLIFFGYIQEGYGVPPNQVAMCAPNG